MSQFVHYDNIEHKITNGGRYSDELSQTYLKEIQDNYNSWRSSNFKLKGPYAHPDPGDTSVIEKRVQYLNEYKDFIDQQHFAEKFDSRSNLHSTVLEEFLFYLFKDLVTEISKNASLGKANVFKDIFFQAPNFRQLTESPHHKFEAKDHDFVIGTKVTGHLQTVGSEIKESLAFDIACVAIECKTYLDKTMLEGSSNAADQLKAKSPDSIYLIVAEWLKLTPNINLRKYKTDQIYVLRKQKNTDREFRFEPGYEKNPIYADVVEHLFRTVRQHLTEDWEGTISSGLEQGFLL